MADIWIDEERYVVRENAMRAIVRLSLTADEYKVLMHLALGSSPSPSHPGWLWLPESYEAYAERAGYSLDQFMRILCGLEAHGITHGLHERSAVWVIHGMPPGDAATRDFQWDVKMDKRPAVLGWVYVIHAKETNWYKIGISKDVEKRATELGAKAPFDVEVVMRQKYPSPKIARQIEAKLHTKFLEYRKNGEWFEFNDDCLMQLRGALGLTPINMQQFID